MNKKKIEIKTSEKKWFDKAIKCYNEKKSFIIIDDKNIGLTHTDFTSGINLIKKVKDSESVSWQQIVGALTGIGVCSAGVYLIILAIADPEPTSTLWLLILGGVTLALTGSISALYSLGVAFIVTGRGGPNGGEFTIEPARN